MIMTIHEARKMQADCLALAQDFLKCSNVLPDVTRMTSEAIRAALDLEKLIEKEQALSMLGPLFSDFPQSPSGSAFDPPVSEQTSRENSDSTRSEEALHDFLRRCHSI